jgi:predicted RNase H-like nuclease (RuvC/YqgF family)
MNGDVPEADADWPRNYFNYFTEIEEHFQRARGTALFLLSPLDWALIENWKTAGVPLTAVLRGIDEAFEKWRSRKNRRRHVNSLAYCAQAVLEVAQRTPEERDRKQAGDAPFAVEELRSHIRGAADQIRRRGEPVFQELAASLEALAAQAEALATNLEDLERRLSAMEDKMAASARTLQTDEDLYRIREALDHELRPYRGKMTADQLSMLERRYLDTDILEHAGLPRLSLFYLR